jgi:hypothetical protein
MKGKGSNRWGDVKAQIEGCDRAGLVGIIRDLYEASATNRRFLHARFVSAASARDEYRRIVRDAVFPDPFSQRPIRLRDATAAINEYKRSTGALAGAVDLMLEFVEAGTEQAADLGYGNEGYFAALERKVNEVVRSLGALPDADRADAEARLIELEQYCGHIGWGYGDFLGEVAASVRNRQAKQTARQPRHAV